MSTKNGNAGIVSKYVNMLENMFVNYGLYVKVNISKKKWNYSRKKIDEIPYYGTQVNNRNKKNDIYAPLLNYIIFTDDVVLIIDNWITWNE